MPTCLAPDCGEPAVIVGSWPRAPKAWCLSCIVPLAAHAHYAKRLHRPGTIAIESGAKKAKTERLTPEARQSAFLHRIREASGKPRTAAEIARELGAPTRTASRDAAALVEQGALRSTTGGYVLAEPVAAAA